MKRDILVIGSGGREHAIVDAIAKSDKCNKIYCLPGNAGIGKIAHCEDISAMEFDKIVAFAKDKAVDLVIVAPDDPLAAGLVDILENEGIRAFGPNKAAAIIEASKSFSKNLMNKYNIPTARYEVFDDYESAKSHLEESEYPIVIKADGLALGKGVLICNTLKDAMDGLHSMMIDNAFGKAGLRVVIEEFMTGQEVTVLAFCDGNTIKPMISSQDHKRAYDNDLGLNTGGMGAFAPSEAYDAKIEQEVVTRIIYPTLKAMAGEGRPFKGVLYFGLMLTPKGPMVVEYNARFGDPETQVVLPLLKTDLIDIFEAIIDERLDKIDIEWSDECTICVIMASGGYPEEYEKGLPIAIGEIDQGIMIYHAGTKIQDGRLVTNGGRVLGVVAKCNTIDEARQLAYENIDKIKFNNVHYRTDIGIKR